MPWHKGHHEAPEHPEIQHQLGLRTKNVQTMVARPWPLAPETAGNGQRERERRLGLERERKSGLERKLAQEQNLEREHARKQARDLEEQEERARRQVRYCHQRQAEEYAQKQEQRQQAQRRQREHEYLEREQALAQAQWKREQCVQKAQSQQKQHERHNGNERSPRMHSQFIQRPDPSPTTMQQHHMRHSPTPPVGQLGNAEDAAPIAPSMALAKWPIAEDPTQSTP